MTHIVDRTDTRSKQIPRPFSGCISSVILSGISAASIASLPPVNAGEPQTSTPYLAQLPEAYELSDVQPTDWAYQALQNLINRYGCVSGDIQHLDLGRRPLTRYEYAVALNACFGQLRWELSNAPLTPEELTLLQRLQEDFALELETFGDRLQTLDDIIGQPFSTTSKLNGEVLFQVGDSFGDDDLGGDDDTQAFSGYRARLNLTTSLTGKDILQTRLQSRDLGRLDRGTGTVMSRLATDGESDGAFGIDLSYEFPITDRLRVVTGIGGVSVNDIATVLNPLSSSGRGAVSRFARRDPGTLRGPGGTGVGIRYQPEDWLELNIGYAAGSGDAASGEGGLGLFNGSHSAIVQAVVEPEENLAVAVAYARNFAQAGDVDLM
ncbi:iron uptake porin, partial [Oscillatoriales cyanobacterium LEGE 11467]